MIKTCDNCGWLTDKAEKTKEGYVLCPTCYEEYKEDMIEMEMKK